MIICQAIGWAIVHRTAACTTCDYRWSFRRVSQIGMTYLSCSHQSRLGVVSGGGTDGAGTFVWSGVYDSREMHLSLIKNYPTHRVYFNGFYKSGKTFEGRFSFPSPLKSYISLIFYFVNRGLGARRFGPRSLSCYKAVTQRVYIFLFCK